MTIDVHIDELVLDGVPATAGRPVGAALRRELARLLARGIPDALSHGGGVSGISATDLQLHPEASPRVVGRQLAAAIYGTLGTL